jgi:hypothetical protein
MFVVDLRSWLDVASASDRYRAVSSSAERKPRKGDRNKASNREGENREIRTKEG